MPRRSLLAIIAVVALAVVVAIVVPYFHAAGPARDIGGPSALAGAPAQSFAVVALDGRKASLAEYRGNVVLANLWATWCAPCRSETPALERLYAANRDRGLVVLGIDQGESAAVAGEFAKRLGLTYPVLLDEDQRYGRSYSAVGLPTSLLIDRTGRIVRGVDGALTYDQMVALVDPLLRAR